MKSKTLKAGIRGLSDKEIKKLLIRLRNFDSYEYSKDSHIKVLVNDFLDEVLILAIERNFSIQFDND